MAMTRAASVIFIYRDGQDEVVSEDVWISIFKSKTLTVTVDRAEGVCENSGGGSGLQNTPVGTLYSCHIPTIQLSFEPHEPHEQCRLSLRGSTLGECREAALPSGLTAREGTTKRGNSSTVNTLLRCRRPGCGIGQGRCSRNQRQRHRLASQSPGGQGDIVRRNRNRSGASSPTGSAQRGKVLSLLPGPQSSSFRLSSSERLRRSGRKCIDRCWLALVAWCSCRRRTRYRSWRGLP